MYRTLVATILGVALLVSSLAGQSFKQITNTGPRSHDSGVVMSADATTLAWVSYDPGDPAYVADIWTWNTTTRTPTLLKKNVSRVSGAILAMSGDGSTLVLASNQQLFVLPLKGGKVKSLATPAGRSAEPGYGMTLSDDGRYLTCTTRPGGANWVCDLEVIDTVTGKWTNITKGTVSEACWGGISGDGSTVAFSARRVSAQSPGQVWITDRSGSSPRKLTSFTSGTTGRVRLDRRGRTAVFVRYTTNQNISGRIHAVLTGTGRTVWLSGPSGITDLGPVISADGDRITWRSHRMVGNALVDDIYMVYPEGSKPRRITTFTDMDPTWGYWADHAMNHDGTVIAFSSGHDPSGTKRSDHEVWVFRDGITQSGHATPGSVVTYRLDDPAAAGHGYLARSALSRGPGIRLPGGIKIPLAPDGLFRISGELPTVFRNFAGTLDARGVGSISVAIPAIPALVGIPYFTSFVSYRTRFQAHNPVRTEIVSGP